MDKKKNTLTEGDVLKALYHMYCAAAYKGSVTMSSETAIGLYNFFHAQKEEIEMLKGEVKEKTETIDFLKEQVLGWKDDYCTLKMRFKTVKAQTIKECTKKLRSIFGEWIFDRKTEDIFKEAEDVSKDDGGEG